MFSGLWVHGTAFLTEARKAVEVSMRGARDRPGGKDMRTQVTVRNQEHE